MSQQHYSLRFYGYNNFHSMRSSWQQQTPNRAVHTNIGTHTHTMTFRMGGCLSIVPVKCTRENQMRYKLTTHQYTWKWKIYMIVFVSVCSVCMYTKRTPAMYTTCYFLWIHCDYIYHRIWSGNFELVWVCLCLCECYASCDRCWFKREENYCK